MFKNRFKYSYAWEGGNGLKMIFDYDYIYEEDYYRMALRRLLKKVDYKLEQQFLSDVVNLKDIYTGTEIHDYIFYNKIK